MLRLRASRKVRKGLINFSPTENTHLGNIDGWFIFHIQAKMERILCLNFYKETSYIIFIYSFAHFLSTISSLPKLFASIAFVWIHTLQKLPTGLLYVSNPNFLPLNYFLVSVFLFFRFDVCYESLFQQLKLYVIVL